MPSVRFREKGKKVAYADTEVGHGVRVNGEWEGVECRDRSRGTAFGGGDHPVAVLELASFSRHGARIVFL
jgi:hypothetical protein